MKEIIIKRYEAEDGTAFETRKECEDYEKKTKKLSHFLTQCILNGDIKFFTEDLEYCDMTECPESIIDYYNEWCMYAVIRTDDAAKALYHAIKNRNGIDNIWNCEDNAEKGIYEYFQGDETWSDLTKLFL